MGHELRVTIRDETLSDVFAIRDLAIAAFDQVAEADLVDALREPGIAGHGAFGRRKASLTLAPPDGPLIML